MPTLQLQMVFLFPPLFKFLFFGFPHLNLTDTYFMMDNLREYLGTLPSPATTPHFLGRRLHPSATSNESFYGGIHACAYGLWTLCLGGVHACTYGYGECMRIRGIVVVVVVVVVAVRSRKCRSWTEGAGQDVQGPRL